MRRVGILIWPAAIALGVAAESVAYSWDDPRAWLPDLAVGLSFIACGWVCRDRARGAGTLLAATGVAWFLGTFSEGLADLHRGPLVHLLLAYPAFRARTRLDLAAIAAGYATAVAAPVGGSDVATIVLAATLIVVAARGYVVAVGRAKRQRLTALHAVVALGAVLIGGAAARLAVPSGDAVEPALLAYEAVLVAIAVGLTARLRGTAAPVVADLVVELGEIRSGTLRERLARALGDPTLEIGYWSAESDAYFGEQGGAVSLPGAGSGRSATSVEREGRRYAMLVHDEAVLGDAALVEAVASATRLSASNVALRAEVRQQMVELTASRRRLLVAADDERRRLEASLRKGPERRLTDLRETLARFPSHEHITRAQIQLAQTLGDLQRLAQGLHPRALAQDGLPGALASLAQLAPVPVDVDVRVQRLPEELEAAAYFVCAEALANVAKHASASRTSLEVTARADRVLVVVADDGIGGAESSRGTGLQGLADRVEALGGTLRVVSPPGVGTRVVAEFPFT